MHRNSHYRKVDQRRPGSGRGLSTKRICPSGLAAQLFGCGLRLERTTIYYEILPLSPAGKKTPLLPLEAAGETPVTIERICCGVLAKPMLLLSASMIVVEGKVAELVLSAT